jgi:hypothetical protein
MKKIIAVLMCVLLMVGLCGCFPDNESARVNQNLNTQANNFNITRQITVFNTRTDTVLFQMTGLMSLSNNSSNELVVIVETGEGVYKKHFIYLSDDTTYIVEDVTGAFVDKYHYELNILPEMIIPVVITSDD